MTFKAPTLSELRARITADIERETGETATSKGDPYFGLSRMWAGVCLGMHKHIDYQGDQIFDDTADDDNIVRRAAEMGLYRIAAVRASGDSAVDLPATDGTVIPAESVLIQGDLSYRVTADATATGGVAVLSVRAIDPGADHNLDEGETLTLTKTISGADTSGTVNATTISGGADIETIERLRTRLEERRQNPPMGGNDDDYVRWAKEAHVDVTRAWCYGNENGPGTVVVRFVTDDLDTPIPTQAHIDAVENYINQPDVRPSGMAGFEVGDLTAKPLDLKFTALTPDNADVRAAIEAELDDYLRRTMAPGSTAPISQINEAISTAAGEDDHTLFETEDVTSTANELIVKGEITWPA